MSKYRSKFASMSRKSKAKRVGIIALLIVAGLSLLCVSALSYLYSAYTLIGEGLSDEKRIICSVDDAALDLSGDTVTTMSGIERCGSLTSLDLSGSSFAQNELTLLYGLDKLEALNLCGTGVTLEQIDELASALPACDILWDVPFGSFTIRSDTTAVSLAEDGITADNYNMLRYLKKLRSVDANGAEITDELIELRRNSTDCTYDWTVTMAGNEYNAATDFIDLNEKQVELDDIMTNLRMLPDLESIELCDSGLTNENMEELMAAYPDIKFVWMIHMCVWDIRTDTTNFSTGHTDPVPRYITDEEVQQLKYCTELVALDLGHNKISDLSFLYSLKKLRSLILVDAPIKDITPISALKHLTYCELFSNEITDVTPLASCTELKELNLCFNYISDTSPLWTLPNLKKLWIARNPLSNNECRRVEDNLPDCEVRVFLTYAAQNHPCGNGWRPIDYRTWGFEYALERNGGMYEKQASISYSYNMTSAKDDPIDPYAYLDEVND